MSRGKRESPWLIIRRCLAIIRRVQHGSTDWKGLVKAVLDEEESAADRYRQRSERLLKKQLHRDLAHIRNSLQIYIHADPRTKEYTIQDADRPLLDLPNEDLNTIAWLEQTFGPNSPKYREVRALLRRLQSYLSPARREQIEQYRTALIMDLGQRDEDRINPDVEAGLIQALSRRQRVEFDYYSPQNPDEQPRRHAVDIYEPTYFDTERGHYYVYGWCHYAVTPTGRDTVNDYIPYRLGRIRNLKILPNKLQPSPPIARQYEVKYWLSQDIARYGVTQRRWINMDRIERQDDGTVIYGTTINLFFAIQELMHYRYKCRVLGGPEMLKEMQKTVQKMSDLYAKPG